MSFRFFSFLLVKVLP